MLFEPKARLQGHFGPRSIGVEINASVDEILLRGPPAELHPIVWLSVARNSPTLARCLNAAVRATRPRCREWWIAFVHRPDWRAVVNALTVAAGSDNETRLLQLAWLGHALARESDPATADEAFWTALLQTEPLLAHSVPNSNAGLAAALLEVAHGEECGFRSWQPATWTAAQTIEDAAAACDLAHLAGEAIALQALEFAGPIRDRLTTAAALASVAESDRWRAAMIEVEHATDIASLTQALLAAQASSAMADVACWLGESNANGRGGFCGPSVVAPRYWSGPRADFEWVLPGSLRQALPLELPANHCGRFYFESSDDFDAARARVADLAIASARAVERWQATSPGVTVESSVENLSERFQTMVAEFAAGAGHEINNPLGAIRGKADWLLRAETDPERRQALQKIVEQVSRIGRMIRDLRLIGVAEAPAAASADWSKATLRAVAAVAQFAPQVDIRVAPIVGASLVRGNEELLERLVAELVRNAAQAAGAGGSVDVRLYPSETGDDVVLEIVDSGPGMAPEVRQRAFGPFYSGRSAGRGLGMGLAVVKRIVDAFDGQIHISWTRPCRVVVGFPSVR